MNIKALIFDLGGVIFNYSFTGTFNKWAELSGKHPDEIRKQISLSDQFEKFERRDISSKQFRESISRLLNFKLTEGAFEEGWNSIYLDLKDNIDELLNELKKNYRIVALTNTNVTHAIVWEKKYAATLKHFEKVFSSHEIRARKPEQKAFQIVLDYLSLLPQETIFLDDKKKHVEGAENLGIKTVLVTSFDQMILDLKKYDILTGYAL
jgi:epoxide hydrolase-like predicted phosphatase